MLMPEMRAIGLPLPLLVTGVRADHQNGAVAPDDLALLAHRLDRRSYLHGTFRREREKRGADAQGPARARPSKIAHASGSPGPWAGTKHPMFDRFSKRA